MMFKLPWSDLPPVNKELLEKYLNKMHDMSQSSNAFIAYLPITVYEYIKAGGINAHLIELRSQASPGMMWIEVRKVERLCGMQEECFEEGVYWGHFAKLMCKYLVEEKGRNSFFCKKTKERVKNSNVYLERPGRRNVRAKETPDIHARLVAESLDCLFCGRFPFLIKDGPAPNKNEEKGLGLGVKHD